MRIGGTRSGRWVPERLSTVAIDVYVGDGPSFESRERCVVTEAAVDRWVVEDRNDRAAPIVIDPGQVKEVRDATYNDNGTTWRQP